MPSPIIVPLDGSPFAEQALPLATEVAVGLGDPIELLLVHTTPPVVPGAGLGGAAVLGLDARMREDERTYLGALTRHLNDKGRVSATPVMLDGPPASTLIEYARSQQARLVVMSTHGRGALSRLFLGSVADRLIRQLDCPILLVHPASDAPSLVPGDRRRVLIPLDGSARAESVIDQVLAIFPRDEVVLELVQVVGPPQGFLVPHDRPSPYLDTIEHALLTANRYLHAVAGRLRGVDLNVHAEVREDSSISHAILGYAHEHRSHLIAMTTHGSGGMDRLLIGSVADKLIRSTQLPMLVWNAPVGASSEVLARTVGMAAEPVP